MALQEGDLQTNQDYLETNRSLLEQNKSFELYLKSIEGLIANNKELIKHTRALIAFAELRSLTEDDYPTINRHKEPYNLGALLRVLRLNAIPEEEIRSAIEMRGIDFEMNTIDERELVSAGASKELLFLIRSSYRR